MLIRARTIKSGSGSGKAVVCSCPLSLLGGIDTSTGKIQDGECESKGLSVAGRVLCFPFGKGSTVGSYALYQLKLNRKAPSAIINESAEPIIATGAIISDIPMVDGVDISLLRTGDSLFVNAEDGSVDLPDVVERHVVTNIVRNKGRILLLLRSSRVGSYRGLWAGVSGFIEPGESEDAAARREMGEEIGGGKVKLLRKIEPQRFRDSDTVWCVHPFLFEMPERTIRIDWEHEAFEWVAPKDVSRYPTVPGLQQVVYKLLGE